MQNTLCEAKHACVHVHMCVSPHVHTLLHATLALVFALILGYLTGYFLLERSVAPGPEQGSGRSMQLEGCTCTQRVEKANCSENQGAN